MPRLPYKGMEVMATGNKDDPGRDAVRNATRSQIDKQKG